jgi:hypothetical protein
VRVRCSSDASSSYKNPPCRHFIRLSLTFKAHSLSIEIFEVRGSSTGVIKGFSLSGLDLCEGTEQRGAGGGPWIAELGYGSMGANWMLHWLAFMTSLAVRQTNAYDPFIPRHKGEIMGARLAKLQ